MVVQISEDIFSSQNFKELNFLLQCLTFKQRYLLFVEYSSVKTCTLFNRIDEDDKKEIEEHFNKIIQEGLSVDYHVSNSQKTNCLNTTEAIRYFNQSVSIVLENSLNDEYFIKAIVEHFDDSGKIQKHINEGWIVFENAGGCNNVKNFLTSKSKSFNSLPQENKFSYLRCIVLLDSDKEYSTAPLKESYNDLLVYFILNNIKHHFLNKRCMENYLPEEVYDYIEVNSVDLENWKNAFKQLSPEQKDFLNINVGFSKAPNKLNRNEIKPEIQNLYSSLSQVNWDYIDKGFTLPNFKTNFPVYFQHHQIHKVTLTNRAGNDIEFLEILKKIEQLI